MIVDPKSVRRMSTDAEHDFEENVGVVDKTNEEDSDFYNYHSEELKTPISSSDDEEEEGSKNPVYPQFDESAKFGYVSLELGMLFTNLSSFKTAVKDYNIHLRREIKWVKNDKNRARAKCKQQECCKWEIFCSWSEFYQSFQIKTFVSKHTCCKEGFKNKQANGKWVVNKLEDKIRTEPGLSRCEARDYLKRDFGVDVSDSKISRAMKRARELVEASQDVLQPAPLSMILASESVEASEDVALSDPPLQQDIPANVSMLMCL